MHSIQLITQLCLTASGDKKMSQRKGWLRADSLTKWRIVHNVLARYTLAARTPLRLSREWSKLTMHQTVQTDDQTIEN